MADYVIGLDFGTHQSKICIQNLRANPHTIEFVEFPNNNGYSLMLPSVVQINNDDTVSYGFVVNDKLKPAQVIEFEVKQPEPVFNLPEPKLNLPAKPELKFISISQPQLPYKKNFRKRKEFQRAQKDYIRKFEYWKLVVESAKNKAKQKYERLYLNWRNECENASQTFNNLKEIWAKEKQEFEIFYNGWKSNPYTKVKKAKHNRYQYFKIPNFRSGYSEKYNNEYTYQYFKISVLYLTNLLFLIETKIPVKYIIQMGVPTNVDSNPNESKLIGQKLLVFAFELKDKFANWKEFLKAKVSTLIEKLQSINIDDKEINDIAENKYWIGIIPEAFAGLISATLNNKITNGIYFSVDIGGGTTDVSLFTISDDRLPVIHGGFSFDKGLNTILEKHLNKREDNSVTTFQKIIALHDCLRNQLVQIDIEAKTEYKTELSKILFTVYTEIIDNAFKKHCIRNTGKINNRLNEAIKYQPIVYSGGGAFYNEIKPQSIGFFNENKVIDISVMGYRLTLLNNHSKVEKLFPILVNSFGLSNPFYEDVEIKPFYEMDVWNILKEIDAEENKSYERYDSSDDY